MGRLIKLAIERPIAVIAMILMTVLFGAVARVEEFFGGC